MRHEIRLALLSAALPVAMAAQPPAAADSGAFLERESPPAPPRGRTTPSACASSSRR